MIPDAILQQIRDRVDIVEVIGGFVPLRRAGRNFKGNCPFHEERSPSFMVSSDKQIFHCFGCAAGGNVFSFLMKIEKKDFREAVETLAERAGVEIPKDKTRSVDTEKRQEAFFKANAFAADFYHKILLEDKRGARARAYLEKRGLRRETIALFKLGFAPQDWDSLYEALKAQSRDTILEKTGLFVTKREGGLIDRFRGRVIFPIPDAKGRSVAFGARVLDDSQPKYLNSPETEIYIKGQHLYGLYEARTAIRTADAVIIVEGYMDAIACFEAGVHNVVASLGTALTPDQVRLLKRQTKNVFILYDADKAGELATLRGLELCLEEGLEVKIVRLPEGHDPDSFVRRQGLDHFQAELGKAVSVFDYKFALLKARYPTRDLEAKVKIANEMVVFLAKVPNEILKSAWTRTLASEMGFSEDALFAQMRKGTGVRPAARARVEEKTNTQTFPAVEKWLLGLFLEDARFVTQALEQGVGPEDFHSPAIRALVERALGGLTQSHEPDVSTILAMIVAELETLEDKEKTFRDCVAWMKRQRVQGEREYLTEELRSAEKENDSNRMRKILYDLHTLNKGITR